jgi:deoxyadenosine/deoxycytidine kinase
MKAWVVVAGNIGAGKSTLTRALAEELGWNEHQELETPNPYLERFYEDMPRWAFHSQTHFLVSGLSTARKIERTDSGAVQDRSLYEHYHVFARDLHAQGRLSDDEWASLSALYYNLEDALRKPDLLVYLQAPTELLLERIRERGRSFEQTIEPEYIERLNRRYTSMLDLWTRSPVLEIPAAKYDVRTAAGRDAAVEEVLHALRSGASESTRR